jgi:hypothetical protein
MNRSDRSLITFKPPHINWQKFLNKWLHDRLSLPNTYVTYNSTTLAQDLTKINITESSRLATFDIKDLYVNIPIEETVHITKVLLTPPRGHRLNVALSVRVERV